MKQYLISLVILLLLIGCNKQKELKLNNTTEKIISNLKWNQDFVTVKNTLIEEFKLNYSEQIEQKESDRNIEVYKFNGGSYNNIETDYWTTTFENDSLVSVLLRIAKENPKENAQIFKKLSELNNKELVREDENNSDKKRWYYEKDGIRISHVIFSSPSPQGSFVIVFMKAV